MLDAAVKEFNGDPQRLYLTGYSMGGFGTWKMADAFPKKWAAIVPICGGGETAWAANIKDILAGVSTATKTACCPSLGRAP